MKNELIILADSYEKSPIIKGLVKLLPYGSAGDSIFSTFFSNLKKKKYHTFFDELQSGKIQLTENVIQTDDFLHAFFSTVNYVERTKEDEKIRRFARILLNVGLRKITFSEFEDYSAIFNELSDREFALLVLKHRYEQKYYPEPGESEFKLNGEPQNPKQITNLYWSDFIREVTEDLSINADEIKPILYRLERTGCYLAHKDYPYSGFNGDGNTTALFHNLLRIID